MSRTIGAISACGLIILGLGACGSEDRSVAPPVETGPAVAYDKWTPGNGDTCTPAIHNQYSVVGPDGKRYPTWHPPVDPQTGCSFGHEHGRDPRGSRLYRGTGPLPFGLANEALDAWDGANPRHEDHVGHKVDWENDVAFHFGSGVADELFTVRCDVLTKLHQGTHSKDAFTNNLHELIYHARCSDGTELHLTLLTAIGTPGEFERSCDRTVTISAGAPTPANSPNGGGVRIIPDRFCVEQFLKVPPGQRSDYRAALHESWEVSASIRAEDGRTLAHVNPYFQVFAPSRFYDPALPNNVGRPIDACYEIDPNGERAQGGLCALSTDTGQVTGIPFDDIRSLFNGADRMVDVNDQLVRNDGGPTVWYTDPFGGHGQTSPFTGSVRQHISSTDNDYGFGVNGPGIGHQRDYGVGMVHAPN